MSAITTSHPAPADRPPIVDVWSRTAPKYRRRTIAMLVIMTFLFAGLCCFTFWLRTGAFWPWLSDDYADIMRRSFVPTGTEQITLSDFLTSPISVQRIRIYGVIMGLLFASLTSIPILVAILYRFPFSALFAAMVVFLAAMPWLGITILAGCVVASLPPFRFSFRYASALMGLIPVAFYFVMASWEPAGSGPKSVQNLALLYAPWVLALLSSCVICAVALAIAKLINYRPGGIPPLLAALFAIPVLLFHYQVGRDELEYRLLERQIGPGSQTMFVPEDIGAAADREANRRWSNTSDESFDLIRRRALEAAVTRVLIDMEEDRARGVAQCVAFTEQFPQSRYIPNVLLLKGQALDARVHRGKLLEKHRAEFRNDLPSIESAHAWESLVQNFPASDLAAMGLYKLAILKTRKGEIDAAIASLDELMNRFDVGRATTQPAPADRAGVFQKAHPSTGLGVELSSVVLQAKRLREMLAACRDDPALPVSELFAGASVAPHAPIRPVQLLLSLDDSDPHYAANLEGIAAHFPHSHAAGYAEVRLALLEPAISRRIRRFKETAASLSGRPEEAEALFYLGDVLQEDSIIDEARATFLDLTKRHPESCWSALAEERLASVSMQERVSLASERSRP